MLKGQKLTDYALGAIEHLDKRIAHANSDIRKEVLTERRDYWIAQYEKETGEKWDKKIQTLEDLERAAPGLPVFEVSEMPEILDLMERYRNEKPETD